MSAAHTPLAPKKPTLGDVPCMHCGHRIGWHDQYVGCRGFACDDLRQLVENWLVENEPPSGYRNEEELPHFVRAALTAAGVTP